MRKLTSSILITLFFLTTMSSHVCAEDQPGTAAIMAARTFTETLDAGDFTGAWQQTSSINQNYSEQRPDWYIKIVAVRPHLGNVSKRILEKLSRHTSWVGLPDGDYLRVSFTTTFQHKAGSLETVVLVKEKGRWVVSSYHLR